MIKLVPHWLEAAQVPEAQVDSKRRSLLKGLASVPLAVPGLAVASAMTEASAAPSEDPILPLIKQKQGQPLTARFLDFKDELDRFRATMRVLRSIEDNDDILFWYHHITFAVPLDRMPVAVARFEGMEFTRHERVGEHAYLHHGHDLSYPRDLVTGKFVDSTVNPVTGKRIKLPGYLPKKLGPTHLLTPKGVIWTGAPSPEPKLGYYMFHQDGSYVVLDWMREPPHYAPANFMETSYGRVSAADFANERITKPMSLTNGSFVYPYPEWMEMGDHPGHMLTTWSGYKLHSVDELPTEFRDRVAAEFPQRLKVDRTAFAEWRRTH